mgnify:CR=1 FL=1
MFKLKKIYQKYIIMTIYNLLTQIKQKQTNLQKNVNDLNQLIYQLEIEIKDKDDESKSQDSDSL